MALPSILLIDDDQERAQQFEVILNFLEYEVQCVTSEDFEPSLDDCENCRAVFVGGGDRQGAVVQAVRDWVDGLPVFLLVGKEKILQVSSTLQDSVTRVLEWPSTYPVLNDALASLPAIEQFVGMTQKKKADKGLAGNSRAIRQIRELIDQVSGSDATVLILGESGTGKEVVAQALHRHSPRRDKPFVPVNCGAIPGELLESELFGHEKGAFTGALTSRQGRFELAEGGTLFLDEIGDMPMPMQVKLLRVLQERTFERVGSNKTLHCDVRVIAATHRQLEEEIREKRFREDLFYRLNVFPIEMPALRERPEDIPYLVHDLNGRMEAAKRDSVRLTKAALAVLMQHDWPGNVRELSNLMERLAIIRPNALVDVDDLPEKFRSYKVPEGVEANVLIEEEEVPEAQEQVHVSRKKEPLLTPVSHLPEQGMDLKEYLSDLESGLIKQALEECNGVVAHAAKLLHMRRTTLVEKLRKYDLS
ncbi:sigma-54 dependent transcriptional regulator [Methylomarinum vadi]|uniref:sigma-54 dependent transcriptional regulator n=1 Tax=Methylomarinum vadi TaxID=438855 RepID=UPI0004DF8E22|nr:sigma-54 dependent transcriptional regulator [Methylomarinum vadi]